MKFLKCGPQRVVNTEHITSLVVGGWEGRATIEAEKRLMELVDELEQGE